MRGRAGAVAGLVALVVLSTACGRVEAGDQATAPSPASAAAAEPVGWDAAWLRMDQVTMRIDVPGPPEGDGPCEIRYQPRVVEDADNVEIVIGVVDRQHGDAGDAAVCNDMLHHVPVEVMLADPLGERPVYDGVQPDARWVARESEAVVPGWLPDGFEWQGAGPDGSTAESRRISGSVEAPGESWSVGLYQQVAAGDSPFDGVGDGLQPIRDLTIHGQPGRLYELPGFNERYVVWRERGWDITVHAQADARPPFPYEDEVIRIAEELVVPESPTAVRP